MSRFWGLSCDKQREWDRILLKRDKAIENHRLRWWWRISMRAERIAFCHGLGREREREWRECSSLLDQKRLDRGNSMYHRAISVSRCIVFILVSIKWSIFIKKKKIGPVPFTFKPKQPSPNRHDPTTQPIHTKAQIEI